MRYLFEKYVWDGKLRMESKDNSKGFRLVSWVCETDHFLPSYGRKPDEITGIFSDFLVLEVRYLFRKYVNGIKLRKESKE